MTRRLLLEMALFATPFLLFLLYRAAATEVSVRERWPLRILSTVGAFLALAGFVAAPLLEPPARGRCFEAQRYENGVTIPGRWVDCAPAAQSAVTAKPLEGEPPPVPPREQRR